MPVAPIPGSGNVPAIWQHYANLLDQEFPNETANGTDIGAEYLAYYNTHPNANARLTYLKIVAAYAELQDVPGALANALSLGTQTAANAATDVPKSLQGINLIGGIFQGLTSRELWVRIVEVGLGIGLVYIGIKKVSEK